MAKRKFVSINAEVAPTIEPIVDPPIVQKYKLVKMEATLKGFNIFEDEISKWIALGWKVQGGIDVKTLSVNGWLLTQAMIKE
jgi:hypothetical protein